MIDASVATIPASDALKRCTIRSEHHGFTARVELD